MKFEQLQWSFSSASSRGLSSCLNVKRSSTRNKYASIKSFFLEQQNTVAKSQRTLEDELCEFSHTLIMRREDFSVRVCGMCIICQHFLWLSALHPCGFHGYRRCWIPAARQTPDRWEQLQLLVRAESCWELRPKKSSNKGLFPSFSVLERHQRHFPVSAELKARLQLRYNLTNHAKKNSRL